MEIKMSYPLAIIGAPSSAGAYAPGQEQAPSALRAAGLVKSLHDRGITADDRGDVAGFRWRLDPANPRAMNVGAAAGVAKAVADQVSSALAGDMNVLVLGGDCTVELGTVAGALAGTENVGLIYIDLDTDLNTPRSTADGALDWMGVAHMLAIEDAEPALAGLGPRLPMLRPEQILFFANDNSKDFERKIIDQYAMAEVRLAQVMANPSSAARSVVEGWAQPFERLLIHMDVDVLDYLNMPLAENYRRNYGLHFDQLVASLRVLLQAPNWAGLTITELNPDHSDEATLERFAQAIAGALSVAPRLQGD
jgi:arginase